MSMTGLYVAVAFLTGWMACRWSMRVEARAIEQAALDLKRTLNQIGLL
jgi:hypothetical protein